jgi:PTS system nitrogen regulatory IIA component
MQLTVNDAARILNVAKKTVYRWIQDGDLPAYRVEGQYRLNRALLLEWATRNKINISPELLSEQPGADALPSLAESLQAGDIFYRVEGRDKAAVLRSMVDLLRLPDTVDRELLFSALWARELLQTTGVGDGFAIPHVRNPVILDVDRPQVSICLLEQPVDFGALDGKPVHTLFTLITPTVRMHLHLLSRLAFALQREGFRAALGRPGTREEILSALKETEATIHVGKNPQGSPT